MGLAFGVTIALLVMIGPGAIIAAGARLPAPVAVAVAPVLTYGAVGLAIVPFGALGIPWNVWTALLTLTVVTAAVAGMAMCTARDRPTGPAPVNRGPVLMVGGGVVLGALLIGWAAARGVPDWQSIPSTWDSVWHANTVRFILDTGQASPTHMGELRNVETHAGLYYPSAFHALTAVLCQLTGAAPTTGCTLAALAASVWLFPVSAAVLTGMLLRPANAAQPSASSAAPAALSANPAQPSASSAAPAAAAAAALSANPAQPSASSAAPAAAAAAALSASFTALPYVEFGTGALPNLVGYGLAVPAFALVASVPAYRNRIPVAVLALVGVFSVHLTAGVVTALLATAWWLGWALRHPVRGRIADLMALTGVAAPTALLLLPQLISVGKQADIIAGHSFLTHEGRKSGLRDALLLHTRHLNDFPIQYTLVALTAIGAALLLVKRIWWPLVLWAVLVVAIVHASAPIGGFPGAVVERFTDLFYSDPRRLMAMLTLLLMPMAGIALATLLGPPAESLARRTRSPGKPSAAPAFRRCAPGVALTAVLLLVASVVLARHYLPRHRLLLGDKYDSVMIDARDLEAFAYLASLPGARDTVIGNANTDGSAWMYAVAGLHPLWTHYDYPMQQGPGPNRFDFWAYADDADTDPRAAAAVDALNIRYVLISSPTVRGFSLPDGLLSLDNSRSWTKIYDNGGARIYEWRGYRAGTPRQQEFQRTFEERGGSGEPG